MLASDATFEPRGVMRRSERLLFFNFVSVARCGWIFVLSIATSWEEGSGIGEPLHTSKRPRTRRHTR